jgi:integrative and conjugative element protein (TIGR02256 family)
VLSYTFGDDSLLIISDRVQSHLKQNRQYKTSAPERGGQLFARFEPNKVIIERATGPRSSDRMSRFFFSPDRKSEQVEINSFFSEKLHYVGDWHSHPQPIAKPSDLDLRTMADCFTRSRHSLSHFVLVIVGQSSLPQCLWVGFCNERETIHLKQVNEVLNDPSI